MSLLRRARRAETTGAASATDSASRRRPLLASRGLWALVVSSALFGACGEKPSAPEEVDLGSGLPDRPPRGLTPEKWGERLFSEQGCLGCHTLHDGRSVGGSLEGIWGSPRSFADGSTSIVDEAYVRESIDAPRKKIVAGFADSMPSYRQRLSQAQVDALVAFLATRR